jgi:hypothetical protein
MGGLEVLGLLNRLGYSIDVVEGVEAQPVAKSGDEVMDRYEGAPEGHINLLAWPG